MALLPKLNPTAAQFQVLQIGVWRALATASAEPPGAPVSVPDVSTLLDEARLELNQRGGPLPTWQVQELAEQLALEGSRIAQCGTADEGVIALPEAEVIADHIAHASTPGRYYLAAYLHALLDRVAETSGPSTQLGSRAADLVDAICRSSNDDAPEVRADLVRFAVGGVDWLLAAHPQSAATAEFQRRRLQTELISGVRLAGAAPITRYDAPDIVEPRQDRMLWLDWHLVNSTLRTVHERGATAAGVSRSADLMTAIWGCRESVGDDVALQWIGYMVDQLELIMGGFSPQSPAATAWNRTRERLEWLTSVPPDELPRGGRSLAIELLLAEETGVWKAMKTRVNDPQASLATISLDLTAATTFLGIARRRSGMLVEPSQVSPSAVWELSGFMARAAATRDAPPPSRSEDSAAQARALGAFREPSPARTRPERLAPAWLVALWIAEPAAEAEGWVERLRHTFSTLRECAAAGRQDVRAVSREQARNLRREARRVAARRDSPAARGWMAVEREVTAWIDEPVAPAALRGHSGPRVRTAARTTPAATSDPGIIATHGRAALHWQHDLGPRLANHPGGWHEGLRERLYEILPAASGRLRPHYFGESSALCLTLAALSVGNDVVSADARSVLLDVALGIVAARLQPAQRNDLRVRWAATCAQLASVTGRPEFRRALDELEGSDPGTVRGAVEPGG